MCATLPDIFNVQGIKTKVVFFDSADDIDVKPVDIKVEPDPDINKGNDTSDTVNYEQIGEYLSDTIDANTNKPPDSHSFADTSLIKNNLSDDNKTENKSNYAKNIQSKFKQPNEKPIKSKNPNKMKKKTNKYNKFHYVSEICSDDAKIIPIGENSAKINYLIKRWTEFHQEKNKSGKNLRKQDNKTMKLPPLYKEIDSPTTQLHSAKSNIPCSMPAVFDDENNNIYENKIRIEKHFDQINVEEQIPRNVIERQIMTKPEMKIKSFSFEKGPEKNKIRISYPILKPSHESVENKIVNNIDSFLTNWADINKKESSDKNDNEMNCDVNVCFVDSKPGNNVSPRRIQNFDPRPNDVTKTNYVQEKHHDFYFKHHPNTTNTSATIVQNKSDPNALLRIVAPPASNRSIIKKDRRPKPKAKRQRYKTTTHRPERPKKKATKLSTNTIEPNQKNQSNGTSLMETLENHYQWQYQQHIMELLRMKSILMYTDTQTNQTEPNYQYRMNQQRSMPTSESNQNVIYPESNQIHNMYTNSLQRVNPNIYMMCQQRMRIPGPNVNFIDPVINKTSHIQPNQIPMNNQNIRPTSLNSPQNNMWRNANMVENQPQQLHPTLFSHLSARTSFTRRSMSRDSGYISPQTDCKDYLEVALQSPTHKGSETSKNTSLAADSECIVCSTKARTVCLKCQGSYYCSTKCQYMDWDSHKYQCKGPVNLKKG